MRVAAGMVACVVGVAATALAVAGVLSIPAPSSAAAALGEALVLAPPLAILAVGAWLTRPAWPRALAGLRGARFDTGPLRRALARSALGPALGVAVLALLARPLGRMPFAFAGLGGLCAYALAEPILLLRRDRWLPHALLSAALFLIALTAIAGIANIGEDAMVFLGPTMLYATLLPLSGVACAVRWAWRRWGADAAPPRGGPGGAAG